MIKNFTTFLLEIKTFSKFKIGDYVILKDTFNGGKNTAIWHNHYGIIIDKYVNFLVHLLSELDEKMIAHLDQYKDSASFYNDKTTLKTTISDIWVYDDYLIKFKTKKEFDDAVNEIEMNKKAIRYNL